MIDVEVPGKGIVEFPEGTPPEEMAKAINKTWYPEMAKPDWMKPGGMTKEGRVPYPMIAPSVAIPWPGESPVTIPAKVGTSDAWPNFQVKPDEGWATAGAKELANVAISVPEFVTSPLGVGTAIAATFAPIPVAAGFAGVMAKEAGWQAGTLWENWSKMTPAEKARSLVDFAASTAFTGLSGLGAYFVSKPKPPPTPPAAPTKPQTPFDLEEFTRAAAEELPLSAEALKQVASPATEGTTIKLEQPPAVVAGEVPKETEVSSASQIASPTGVSEREVRSRMGEEAPLRQPGETPAASASPPAIPASEAPGRVVEKVGPELEEIKPNPPVEDYVEPEPTETVVKREEFAKKPAPTSPERPPQNPAKMLRQGENLNQFLHRATDEELMAMQTNGNAYTEWLREEQNYRKKTNDPTWKDLNPYIYDADGFASAANWELTRRNSERSASTPPSPEPPPSPAKQKEPVTTETKPAVATAEKQAKAPGVEQGPGVVGTEGSLGPGAQAAKQPMPAQIEQLTSAFGQKAPAKERLQAAVRESFSFGERISQAKDAVSRAVAGLKSAGDRIWKALSTFEKPDDLLKAKGELSAELETRGWRVREFAKAVKRQIPDVRRRAAIAKWIDAGGDAATLQQGLANTKPAYRQAYADALKLSGDDLTAAQNIANFFEARLQEAIDAGVLEHGIADYIHRIYEKDSPQRKNMLAYVQSGILSKNPSLAKKRLFQFDWEAEQAGLKPVRDFLPRITDYETSLSKAIAAREFIKKLTDMKAADGRPIIGVKGVGIPIEDPVTGAREGTIIKPLGDFKKASNPADPLNYRGDYKDREYPALSKWKWVGSDAADKPIFLQGDVAIHPEYVGRIDALLQPSQVRFGRFPKTGQTALNVGATFKQTMLDMSGFHHVQIAVHAMEHRVFPWGIIKEIDFENPRVVSLLKGGVTLGGEYHSSNLGEGLVGRSLTRHIPGLGAVMESYHSYLFQSLIPRIKMTMALHALERNRKVYAKDLASGKMTETDLNYLTAKQANAAFGELSYIMKERSKTVQDMLRIILLAPDFLEARAQFVGQALTKYGTEQRVALALGAVTMWTLARIFNKAIDDQYHLERENLFSIVYKGDAYGLRTVQGDVLHLMDKPVQFWMSRLNPVYGRTMLQLMTQRDWFGRKRSVMETLWDSVNNIVPIALRSSRERSIYESMLNAFGVTARRYNDVDDAFKLAQEWKKAHGIQEKGEFIYDPDKDPLRPLKIALVRQDEGGAVVELKKLIDSKATTYGKLNDYFSRYATMPFSGSQANERKFLSSLTEDQKKTVESARQTKKRIRALYLRARNQLTPAFSFSPPPLTEGR